MCRVPCTGVGLGARHGSGRGANRPQNPTEPRASASGPGGPQRPCTTTCQILRTPRGFMWGRLAACGRLREPPGRGPASGARLHARRSGPRQPGISPAVGLRLCCSAGQVFNLRPRPGGTRNRPNAGFVQTPTGGLQTRRRLKTCPTSHRRIHFQVALDRPIP